MNAIDLFVPSNTFLHPRPITNLWLIPLRKHSKPLKFNQCPPKCHPSRPLFSFPRNAASNPAPESDSRDDFISRVLSENPSQVEPRHLVGSRLYTLREKENLKKASDGGMLQFTKKLYEKLGIRREGDEVRARKGESSDPVYLKDILREFKGKLYVPEEVFKVRLSEEEEFDRNLKKLPWMTFEDFQKAWKSDKVKLLTSKSVAGVDSDYGHRDFIVDLKEIPGDKRLQRTKW